MKIEHDMLNSYPKSHQCNNLTLTSIKRIDSIAFENAKNRNNISKLRAMLVKKTNFTAVDLLVLPPHHPTEL